MNEGAEASESAFWDDADDAEALRRYRTLVNEIDDGLYRLDADGRFVGVNDVLVTATGHGREELLGESVGRLFDAEDNATLERETERQLAGDDRVESLSVSLRTADGDAISADVRVSVLVEDGAFRGTTGVVRMRTPNERGQRVRPAGASETGPEAAPTESGDSAERTDRERSDPNERPADPRPADVLDAAPVGVVVRDADEDVVRANDRASELLGVSAREREAEFETASTAEPESGRAAESETESSRSDGDERRSDDEVGPRFYDAAGRPLPADERPFARASERGEAVSDRVLQVEGSSGDRQWLSVAAAPLRTDDGDEHVVLTYDDVTDCKERERELEEYRSHYQTLIENFPNGAVALVDENLRYVSVGGTPVGGTDVTRDDLEGELLADSLPTELAEVVVPHYEAALDGETASFESTLGGRFYRFHFVPVRDDDGDVFAALGMSQDVTERKRAERELEEHRKQLETLFEVLPVGVVVADADGGVVDANEAATEMLGSDVSDLDSVTENDHYQGRWADTGDPVAADEWTLARVLRGEEVTDSDVYELERDDGERRTVMVHGMPIRDASGEVTRGVVTLTDVTERKEHEQALEEQNERLESFASMLAHELRNPVTIGQIYGQQLPAETAPEAVEYVTEAFDRIEEMIDVMLILTRGREAVGECNALSLADVTREAWDEVDAPETTLSVGVEDVVQADETYLRHLFRNLFENALQHGGATEVRVGESDAGFHVADDGNGIPESDRERVFEAGFTTAAGEGGTGLGLAFVRELADVYGWTVTVTESESGGARFEFRNADGGEE